MRVRLILSFIVVLLCSIKAINAQILHTESFAVILDTAKSIKGSITPDLKFQTQREDLIEFENVTNISIRLKNRAITIANKIEVSKFGDEVLLSGGYLYVEYRNIFDGKIVLEPFAQFHWSEARGLEFKYAGGIYLRYRIISKKNLGLFAALGPFYEFERWNFDGVEESLVPVDASKRKSRQVKLGDYVSFKFKPKDNIFLDFSVYHQSRFDQIFSTPRLASSSSITYSFTEHLGLTLLYQNIYDFKPIVPIDKLFNKVVFTIAISF